MSKARSPWIYGNIKLELDAPGPSETVDRAGDALLDLFRGERMESVKFREATGGIGGSEMMDKRVSAPTMPPIEWPIRMTRTEGSTVGEGVDAETSRSMTLF